MDEGEKTVDAEVKDKSAHMSDEIKYWKEIIPDCKIVFDVGCGNDNIFHEINPGLEQIHLFDPNESEIVLEDIKDKKNVFYNTFALGSMNEEKDFYYRCSTFMYRPEEKKFKNRFQTKRVVIKKLCDYVAEKNINHIDFLKIDCEGHDFEVIKGCERFIDNIKYIQFENFVKFYDNKTLDDIFAYLKGWNFYFVGGIPENYLATKEILTILPQKFV